MEVKTFNINKEEQGNRLDKVLTTELDISRKRARDLLDQEKVQVNGKLVKPKYAVQEGDMVQVEIPPLETAEILPEKMDLDIIYEDQDVLVVNKPKGLVVHPAPGHYSGTLVNGLMAHCKDLSGINGVMRPGIVHRIDKDTSGLLVVCKNDQAHESISKQLASKECSREYVAIVHGVIPHAYGTIDAPIGRDEKDRQRMAVTAKNSKKAVTHFKVLKTFKNYTYISCKLETGRTHQIRVHMRYIDHPIAGDPKYGPRKTLDTNGQLLHACALEFTHPRTHERMRFEAPLDPIFADVLGKLERGELE